MKIALPTRDGVVDQHFGHCEYFTIMTVDESRQIVEEERLTPPPGCGCKSNIVPVLVEKGVKVLLGGNMGQGAVDKLESHGIQVVRGAQGAVQDVAASWLEGRLTDKQEICHAHGHEGCHGH
jgi:predicted Fe-Mo cluster-binding NifX family protein